MSDYKDVLSAQRGDRAAFGRLVERYQGLVFGICCRMTAQRFDAEDLAHDALVEAYLKLPSLRDPERFEGWLRTLTLNICRMWHRQRRPVPVEVPVPGAVEEVGDTRAAGALADLSRAHRLALALHYGEGLSYAEMARFLAVPVGTVMSRLSRARRALKDTLEESEEEKMGSGRDLQAEVDAEIEVLLKLFGADVDSMERLSAVLAHSPERFRQVVAQVEVPTGVEPVAMLVRNLGQPAIESVVGSYFDGEAEIRAQALAILVRLIGSWKDREKTEHGWQLPLLPQAHMLLNVVMVAPQPVDAQIALLVDLLEHMEGKAVVPEGTLAIFICVLRGYGDPAYAILSERFMQLAPRRKTTHFDPLVAVLQAFSTPFCRAVTELLQSGDRDRVALGLRGAEGLAAGLWHPDGTRKERAYERRIRGIRFLDQMDAGCFEAMVQAVAAACGQVDGDLRPWAMEVLGMLPAQGHAAVARAGLGDDDPAVRLAAITTVSAMGDKESVAELMECARQGETAVRRRAVEALSHMRARAAKPLLEALLDDPNADIRKAAITRLADIGDEGSREKLAVLMRGKDKKLARLAAQALHRWQKLAQEEEVEPEQRVLGTTVKNMRDGEQPIGNLHLSVVAAVGGLPELRDYEELELTRLIARVCGDYSGVRRKLVSGRDALMRREKGVYSFEPLGEAVWRVEHFIQENFLALERY